METKHKNQKQNAKKTSLQRAACGELLPAAQRKKNASGGLRN